MCDVSCVVSVWCVCVVVAEWRKTGLRKEREMTIVRVGPRGNLGHKIGAKFPTSVAAFGMYFSAHSTPRWAKECVEGFRLSPPLALPPML